MRNVLVFVSYFLIAFLFFFKGHQGMLVTDVNGWFNSYQQMGWKGLAVGFGDKSLHYMYHLVFFLCYKLFGFHTARWAAFYIFIHALAATSAFIFFKRIYAVLNLPYAAFTSYAGSLLFLINAYNAEPVLWAACIHYPLCIIFTLSALLCMIEYSLYGKKISAVLFVICFIIALFLLELSLALPLICIPILLVLHHSGFSKQKFLSLQAVSVLIVAGYIVLNKIKFGSVVGHYGAAIHLNTDPVLLGSNLDKYLNKYFAFSPFWPAERMGNLYGFFETSKFVYGSIGFYVGLIVLFLIFRRHISVRLQTALLFLVCAVMALAPVLNLFFTFIVHNECDRLGYFFAVFFAHALSLLAFSFLPLGIPLLLIYLGLNIHFLKKNVSDWKNAGAVEQNLLLTYKWQNKPDVFILNLPDNYDGAYMYRSFDSTSEFKDAIHVRGIKTGRITEILKYNMMNLTDSVTVSKVSDNELRVIFGQWGNWWWLGGKGADSYSTDEYEVKIDQWSHAYVIRFKKKNGTAVYLYQCGKEWREIKF